MISSLTRMRTFWMIIASATIFAGAAMPAYSADASAKVSMNAARHDLAPSGRLRAAINYSNVVLAQRSPSGELTGVSVMLAQDLGKRLHVPVDLVPFNAAGAVFDAMDKHQWDVAFLAIEPERAQKIDFSPPYVFIDGTYLVHKDSRFKTADDLDRDGVHVVVAKGAAYDLSLTRTLKHATLERNVGSSQDAIDYFVKQNFDAVAGIRQILVDAAKKNPDLRVVDGRFARIEQAVAVPLGHDAGAAFVRAWLEQMKSSGKIRKALDDTGQDGAIVAPPAAGSK